MIDVETLFQTPGVGGAVAATAILTLITCYGLTIRWISRGHED
jgi:hypothetical protein